jgi:hypothetical protein
LSCDGDARQPLATWLADVVYEFSSAALPLPESLLQFEFAHTVAELVFYVTEWSRLPSSVTSTKSAAEFCMDALVDILTGWVPKSFRPSSFSISF